MTHLYVALTILMHGAAGRARRNERGQGTLEYVGMVAVAALIVVAVIGVAKGVNLGGIITDAVGSVKGAITGNDG